MKYARGGLASIMFLMMSNISNAAIPDLYTNQNFWTSEHDIPLNFELDTLGNLEGVTESGKVFRQTIVESSASVRLHRFSIDEAFYYVSDKGIIMAASDLEALSLYLTM